MRKNVLTTESFDVLAHEAASLVVASRSMREQARLAREQIELISRQLETIDLRRVMSGMRHFAEIVRNPHPTVA